MLGRVRVVDRVRVRQRTQGVRVIVVGRVTVVDRVRVLKGYGN